MDPDVMAQCADLIFADAVQDIAKQTGRPISEVRSSIIESPAYNALYDFETGLWGTGPDYFVDFFNLIRQLVENDLQCAGMI